MAALDATDGEPGYCSAVSIRTLDAVGGYRPCPCQAGPGGVRLQCQRTERSNGEVPLRPCRPFAGRREVLRCAQQALELIPSRRQLPGRVQCPLG